MFESLMKSKCDLSNGFPTAILKQVFNALKKWRISNTVIKNTVIVKEVF